MTQHLKAILLLFVLSLILYWPHQQSEFVLDDYYTIVQNSLIKQPSLYPKIFSSRLFDAHKSSGYIKLPYYRPILELSFALDYQFFKLQVIGYKWMNVLIHFLNAVLIYYLIILIFHEWPLAFKASTLFLVLPIHEWVVRYITGRGDSLQTLFGLCALIAFTKFYKSKHLGWILTTIVFFVLGVLTKEFGLWMVFYMALIWFTLKNHLSVTKFSLGWIFIGLTSFFVVYPLIGKLGSILALHFLYFLSIGACLVLSQARPRFMIILITVFAILSFEHGAHWKGEAAILKKTISKEWSNETTVCRQQLLMKYENDWMAIRELSLKEINPIKKSMWLNRLGAMLREHYEDEKANWCFKEAFRLNPANVNALNLRAVMLLERFNYLHGRQILHQSLSIDPHYPETLRLLGVYYFNKGDFANSKKYLNEALFLEPDNLQVQQLLHSEAMMK